MHPRLHSIGDHPPRARIIRAFLVAPLAAPVAYSVALLGGTIVGPSSVPSVRSAAELVLTIFAVGGACAYAAAILAGGPIYLLLRRLALVSRWTLWLGGIAIGVTVALLLAPSLRGELFSIPFPWWVGALLGLVSAEAFLRLLAPRVPAGTGTAV
jgi:hypothetical protein